MTSVSEEDYAGMFGMCADAFRLETQPAYLTSPAEAEALAGYLAGRPQPPSAFPEWQSWLDQMRELTAGGKRFARVRIIDSPPTGYQRWMLWATRYHRDAGEDIRYLPRESAEALGIPRGDWQIFDHVRLVLMEFTSAGEPGGKTLVTSPDTIRRYTGWRDLAVTHATMAEAIPV